MGLRDALDSAWMVLLANRLRSLLTVLGVVIGVAIVILLVSMGESARQYVSEQVQSMGFGANVLVVHPGRIDPPVSASRLTYEDAQEIQRKVDAVADLMPVVMGTVRLRSGSQQPRHLVVGSDRYLPHAGQLPGARKGASSTRARSTAASPCACWAARSRRPSSPRSPPWDATVRVGGRKFHVTWRDGGEGRDGGLRPGRHGHHPRHHRPGPARDQPSPRTRGLDPLRGEPSTGPARASPTSCSRATSAPVTSTSTRRVRP